jgi:DUF1680 family protein
MKDETPEYPDRDHPQPVSDVEIEDTFWSPRRATTRSETLPAIYESLEGTGRIENLQKAAEPEGVPSPEPESRMYRDESDVYKWLEAASNGLNEGLDDDTERAVNHVIELLETAQEEDGYINSYFTTSEQDSRWSNLVAMHELYSAGHLFEAAVAHHDATGETRLLDIATRFADHIYETFGPGGRDGIPGHPEIEIGLLRLSRATGEDRYRELASEFIDRRGQPDSPLAAELRDPETLTGATSVNDAYRDLLFEDGEYDGRYAQDHKPVRDQRKIEGHAVKAGYLFTAVAGLAAETGDVELATAAKRVWENMATRRMYVSGGIGNSHANEGFTRDFDLPHDLAYAETCAAVGSSKWSREMLRLTGNSRYVDLLERVLYNGFLVGISLDGRKFSYVNPLESNGERHPLHSLAPGRFTYERQPWFETPCCPPNAARLLTSLDKYVYARTDDSVYVNLFVGSLTSLTLDSTRVHIQQVTDYPWDGEVEISISTEDPVEFPLFTRIPGWCESFECRIDGTRRNPPIKNGYARIEREWIDDSTVQMSLPMAVRRIHAHPNVSDARGQVSLCRGPLVYCFEGLDNETPLHRITIPDSPSFETTFRSDLLGGVITIDGEAEFTTTESWDGSLYRESDRELATRPTQVRAVPYYAWGNRGAHEMRVWIPRSD